MNILIKASWTYDLFERPVKKTSVNNLFLRKSNFSKLDSFMFRALRIRLEDHLQIIRISEKVLEGIVDDFWKIDFCSFRMFVCNQKDTIKTPPQRTLL